MIFRRNPRAFLLAAAVLATSPAAVAAPGRDLILQAEAALKQGEGIAAELAVKQALEAGVPRAEVAALRGEAELLQGDPDAARKWLEPGAFTPATHERGFRALARLEIEEGDLPAAARAYDRALSGGPGSAPLWVEIGRLRYRSGQHHLALAAAIKALELDSREPRALEFRGQLVRDAAGPLGALPWFERGLQQAPDDLSLLGEYAATLAEAGRNRDMLRAARRMVEIDPRHPRAYFLQAVLASRTGNYGLARRLLDRTNGAYSDTEAGRLLAGIVELQAGSPAFAAEQFDALTHIQPDNADVAMLLGKALLASGDAEEVVSRFAEAAERPGASPYLLTLVGRAYEQLDMRKEAARLLDRAAEPRSATMSVLPAVAGASIGSEAQSAVPQLRQLLAQGRRNDAIVMANRLARRFPASADVEILGGDVALLAGNPQAALAIYARAAAVRRDFSLVERMVAAQRMLGREDEARGLLAGYLVQNPRSAPAAALLGRMEAQGGNWAAGAALLNFANNAGGGQDPLLLADLAETHLRRDERAADLARRAYRLQRSNSRVAATLARILEAEGDSGAKALLAKVQRKADTPLLAHR